MNLKYQEIIFDWVLYLSWILYFTAYFGIMIVCPTHQELYGIIRYCYEILYFVIFDRSVQSFSINQFYQF